MNDDAREEKYMRRVVVAAVLAASSLLLAVTPSAAGYLPVNCHPDDGFVQVADGYGHVPTCWVKKIRSYDDYGNLIVKKVRVCR